MFVKYRHVCNLLSLLIFSHNKFTQGTLTNSHKHYFFPPLVIHTHHIWLYRFFLTPPKTEDLMVPTVIQSLENKLNQRFFVSIATTTIVAILLLYRTKNFRLDSWEIYYNTNSHGLDSLIFQIFLHESKNYNTVFFLLTDILTLSKFLLCDQKTCLLAMSISTAQARVVCFNYHEQDQRPLSHQG